MSVSIQLTVFEVDKRQFAVPLERVERVVRAVDTTPLPRAPAIVLGLINLHGTLMPVLSVRHRVGAIVHPLKLDDQFVIVRTSKRTVALVVDEVRGLCACPATAVTSPEAVLPDWKEVKGIVQLEGGLTLIQDIDRFLSLHEEQLLEEVIKEQANRAT